MWAIMFAMIAQAVTTTSASTVICSGTASAAGREFVLDRPAAGEPWRLSYRDREHPSWIRLVLDGADPVFGAGTATLRFRNANGGRQVELDVTPTRARIDVYVDYGLDVNVESALAPEVDRMNTNGSLTSVSCRIDAAPANK